MPRGQRVKRSIRRFAAADALPRSREMTVRAGDGTRLHAEVFGPEDGYPIVLAHGITCAIRVWAYQIADLARDHRVIAYDHRGHCRSGLPSRRRNYGLNYLAADLDAVLEATLQPGERAVIAGHSMGGIAITSWAERYPRRVSERADAVALINTTTGELLRHVQLVPVPVYSGAVAVATRSARITVTAATPPVAAQLSVTNRSPFFTSAFVNSGAVSSYLNPNARGALVCPARSVHVPMTLASPSGPGHGFPACRLRWGFSKSAPPMTSNDSTSRRSAKNSST